MICVIKQAPTGDRGNSFVLPALLGLDRLNDLLPPDLKFRSDEIGRNPGKGKRH